jgi:diguanylate cyclase (GGDEF)-like protein
MNREKDKKIQDLLKRIKRLKQLSLCDELTGLFNRRKLEEDLQRYIELHKRHNILFSIIMIDIDNFKNINDTRGHIIGDRVLKQVADILKNNIRKSDRAYRYAGDEFIVIFSHYKSKIEIIRRIRQALQDINISISIGVCDLKDKYSQEILQKIDKKMYEEKRHK